MITQSEGITAKGELCFFCGQPTEDPAIQWTGNPHTIFLHPTCAVDFLLRLARDVHEMQCKGPLPEFASAYQQYAAGWYAGRGRP